MTHLILDLKAVPSYQYQNGLLKHERKVFIGQKGDLEKKILAEFHSGQTRGHSRTQATFIRAYLYFFWPEMKENVKQ